MKRSLLLIALLTLALTLTACGGTPVQTVDAVPVADAQPAVDTVEAAPAADAPTVDAARPVLDMSYEGALSQKLLLSLGTLELADTEYALNAEQAGLMLFYWQALNNMTASGNSATEEVAAILLQIEETFTPEQITAINRMQMTTAYMQVWATENQISMGTGAGAGGGQGQGGGGGMDADARATRQAAEGATGAGAAGENGISGAINKAVIAYLESIQ